MKRFALLSVSDKTGLVDFARQLEASHGFTLLSTGGTAKAIRDAGIPVMDVSEYTGFPEMMDGRVKTLHPKVHGGLLCKRDEPSHKQAAESAEIGMIDLLVVNLYPFVETISRRGTTLEEAIEQIDIGGPAMLRSAAKNHASVLTLCDPEDYPKALKALDNPAELDGLRPEMAVKVFEHTSLYDREIARYLKANLEPTDPTSISGLPETLDVVSTPSKRLRYGENPHQQAVLYGKFFDAYDQLQGKELSFNNLLDITASTYLIGEFQKPTVAILKHTNPCGVASGDTIEEAWELAYATDQQAPFGGIIVTNQTVGADFAQKVSGLFCEVVIAPDFDSGAREIFARKKNLRLIQAKEGLGPESLYDLRSVVGGYLLQDRDHTPINPRKFEVLTKRQPTPEEFADLLFGWRVVRHVKSNAIVYAGGERTLGIGAGQMSRVDSSRIAIWKAGEAGLSLKNSVIASDAFFPFPDGLVAAAEAGCRAAIQPGGSIRDKDVIAAADEHDMAMIFTGQRFFKH